MISGVVRTDNLTALDATFLELEQADDSAHMHIGGVMVFDSLPEALAPTTGALASHLERRLPALPRYRQRLSEPRAGGMRWPAWEEDPNFHVGNHVRRVALPAPGGEAQLLEWAGEYFSQRLDRRRPLWEILVLEGLAGGRWALVSKTHHCMVDGVGSVDVSHLLLDAKPVPPGGRWIGGEGGANEGSGEGGKPDTGGTARAVASGLLGAASSAARLPFRVAAAGIGVLAPERAREALERSRAMAEVLMRDEVAAAPQTSLNDPIGAHRRLAVLRAPLRDFKEIKNVMGGTVNDVVLAIAAGGFRELLQKRGEPLPLQGLRAMVPMNIRAAGRRLELGNKVTSLFVHLPVAERDPLTRYRRQVEETEAVKDGRQALGSKTLIDLTALAPPALHGFLARSLFATRLFNVTVTNVPGPPAPLYAFGSRMREVWPLVPIAASHAVGIAVISYDGELFFCVNADRDSVADLAVLHDGMLNSLRELRELAIKRTAQSGG